MAKRKLIIRRQPDQSEQMTLQEVYSDFKPPALIDKLIEGKEYLVRHPSKEEIENAMEEYIAYSDVFDEPQDPLPFLIGFYRGRGYTMEKAYELAKENTSW